MFAIYIFYAILIKCSNLHAMSCFFQFTFFTKCIVSIIRKISSSTFSIIFLKFLGFPGNIISNFYVSEIKLRRTTPIFWCYSGFGPKLGLARLRFVSKNTVQFEFTFSSYPEFLNAKNIEKYRRSYIVSSLLIVIHC